MIRRATPPREPPIAGPIIGWCAVEGVGVDVDVDAVVGKDEHLM